MMYSMKDEYLLGIPSIDDQHTRLFELTNDAYKLLKDENILYKDDALLEIIEGIKEYVKKHFREEEEYMGSFAYSALENHKLLHELFRKKVNDFSDNVNTLSLKTQDQIILDLLDYLVMWLEKHICEEDRKYVQEAEDKKRADV